MRGWLVLPDSYRWRRIPDPASPAATLHPGAPRIATGDCCRVRSGAPAVRIVSGLSEENAPFAPKWLAGAKFPSTPPRCPSVNAPLAAVKGGPNRGRASRRKEKVAPPIEKHTRPTGSDALSVRKDARPMTKDARPTGNGAFSTSREASPMRKATQPTRIDAQQRVKGVLPTCRDSLPTRTDAPPIGRDALPMRNDARRAGRDAPPIGNDARRIEKVTRQNEETRSQ